MQKWTIYVVISMWAVLLVGGAFRPQTASGAAKPTPRVGFLAPPFTLSDPQGRPVALESLQGKAVFLNFWASWCPPCRLEMPEIQRLASTLPPGTVLLTVNMTASESSPATALAYLKEHGYTFPVLMDARGEAGESYQVLSLPTSLFINRGGVVTARIAGPLTYGAMVDYLKAAGR